MSKHFRSWYVVTIDITGREQETAANRCFELGSTGIEQTGQAVQAYFPENVDMQAIAAGLKEYFADLVDMKILTSAPTVKTGTVSEENWAENWKEHFKPMAIGARMLVVPPWEKTAVSEGRFTIVIEPGMAFGTGGHESTELALVLLERICKPGMSVCDAGTGTGIIAIAAVLFGADSVYAFDPDEEAVRAALVNCRENGVDKAVSVGQHGIETANTNRYDIVAANLSRTLILENAEKIIEMTAPGGYIIVSGIEKDDAGVVTSDFSQRGLSLYDSVEKKSWIGLAFKKNDESM